LNVFPVSRGVMFLKNMQTLAVTVCATSVSVLNALLQENLTPLAVVTFLINSLGHVYASTFDKLLRIETLTPTFRVKISIFGHTYLTNNFADTNWLSWKVNCLACLLVSHNSQSTSNFSSPASQCKFWQKLATKLLFKKLQVKLIQTHFRSRFLSHTNLYYCE
jgi:hypothetical protein